ncbi:hypothetical protein [Glaciihabitans tibetensis]|nr:hypothetical protein [Glaciihabitans tibetensis]
MEKRPPGRSPSFIREQLSPSGTLTPLLPLLLLLLLLRVNSAAKR